MTTFDDREKSAERKFAHDEESLFKAHARRDKLFGLWAAGKMGLAGSEAETYARAIVTEDIVHPGDQAIAVKVMADLKAKGVAVSAVELATKLDEFFATAKQQIAGDMKS